MRTRFLPGTAFLALAAWMVCAATTRAETGHWDRSFSAGTAILPAAARPGATDGGSLSLFDGRVNLLVPGRSAEEARTAAGDLEARMAPLFRSGPWRFAFLPSSPLRIVLRISSGGPSSRVRLYEVRRGAALSPVIDLDMAGRSLAEAGEEAVRGAALLALHAWAPEAPLGPAAAAARAVALPEELTEADREEIREAAASPSASLADGNREILAGLWIREMIRSAGADFLPGVWKKVAAGEDAYSSLASSYSEATGESSAEAFGRALRRAYSTVDVLPDFSRLPEEELESGGLDASDPGSLSWRFTATEPTREGGERLAWPEDGARGFAVVHYEDLLPDDLMEFSPGEQKILPFSGVARIDWIVWGEGGSRSPLAAPVSAVPEERYPVVGLSAKAESSAADGVRLEWSTASHRDLSGWAILRREVDGAGGVSMSSPEWLPTREEDREGSSYFFIDASAVAGRYYRYDVWAVTGEGTLSRSFRVTLQAR